MDRADNQDIGEQGRSVRHGMHQCYRPEFHTVFSLQSPQESTMKRTKKIKKTPRISHHLSADGAGTSITEFDA